jgi:hypothetical protein
MIIYTKSGEGMPGVWSFSSELIRCISSLSIWLLYKINVRLPLVTGLLYQRELVPVAAFYDVRSAFLAFLGKKITSGDGF